MLLLSVLPWRVSQRITDAINRAKEDTVSGIFRGQCLCFRYFVIGHVR